MTNQDALFQGLAFICALSSALLSTDPTRLDADAKRKLIDDMFAGRDAIFHSAPKCIAVSCGAFAGPVSSD